MTPAASKLPANLLQKIAASRASGHRYPNHTDGFYVEEIRKVDIEAAFSGNVFILELGIVEAKVQIAGIEPNKVGTIAANVINLDTNKSGMGNVKAFLLKVLNVDEETMAHSGHFTCCGGTQQNPCQKPAGTLMTEAERTDEIARTLAAVIAPNQPLMGYLIGNNTYRTKIKGGPNAGKDFVGNGWVNYPQTREQVAARRALIEQGTIGSPIRN